MSDKEEIRLLYVDDEEILHRTFKLTMEMLTDFEVESALSGEEALDMLEKESYDAIISDYDMPGMDGIELLNVIRDKGINTPYIIFTGKSSEDVVIEALNSGADFYLLKGSDIDTICSELKRKIPPLVEERSAKRTHFRKKKVMQNLIDSSPDSAFLLDGDKKILTMNRGGADFINSFSEEAGSDLTGRSFYDILPHEIAEIKFNFANKAVEEGKETIFYEEYLGKRYKTYISPHYDCDRILQYISYFQRPIRNRNNSEANDSISPALEDKLRDYKDNLSEIQFPLTADISAAILFRLSKGPKSTDELSKITNSSSSNITSRLKILKEKGLTLKNEKEYRLSIPGKIIVDKLKNFIRSLNSDYGNAGNRKNTVVNDENTEYFINNKSDAQAIIRSTLVTTTLLALMEGTKTRHLLRDITGSSSVALSPRLSMLKEKGLIEENGHDYLLTKKGRIIASQLEEYILTSAVIYKNFGFWMNHSLDWMPDLAKDTLYELIHAEIEYNSPDEIVHNSELHNDHILEPKYLHGISDYSLLSLSSISLPRICSHHNCEFIISEDAEKEGSEFNSMIEDMDERFTSFVKIHVARFPHTFSIIVTERYFEMKLMTDDCRFFDSMQYLASTSPEACLWGERLFQYYRNLSSPSKTINPVSKNETIN